MSDYEILKSIFGKVDEDFDSEYIEEYFPDSKIFNYCDTMYVFDSEGKFNYVTRNF